MSLKSSLLALANNIGMCQENARSIKQALLGGLSEAAAAEVNPWSSLNAVTGDSDINIPEGCHELLILGTANTRTVTINIPIASLLETDLVFYGGGYGGDSNNMNAAYKVNTTRVKLVDFHFSGTSYYSSAITTVYYR